METLIKLGFSVKTNQDCESAARTERQIKGDRKKKDALKSCNNTTHVRAAQRLSLLIHNQ